jgi:magnesium transporter
MTQNLNHYEKILSRSHSNYLAQISIEMTDANNQINDVLSKLTALGTVLIPMNLVTGNLIEIPLTHETVLLTPA